MAGFERLVRMIHFPCLKGHLIDAVGAEAGKEDVPGGGSVVGLGQPRNVVQERLRRLQEVEAEALLPSRLKGCI
jgi:hypothetical protein